MIKHLDSGCNGAAYCQFLIIPFLKVEGLMNYFNVKNYLFTVLAAMCMSMVLPDALEASVKPRPLGPSKCFQIYYDRVPGQRYHVGRTHALYLQNLVGHFPNIQQYIIPISLYKKGDIENCSLRYIWEPTTIIISPSTFFTIS